MERPETGRESLRQRYLLGQCMVMAATLSDRHALPTVGIYDADWITVPRHVGVEVRPGIYADARGLELDRDAFLEGYVSEDVEIRPIARNDMRRIWGHRIASWLVPEPELVALGIDQRSLAA